MRDTIYGDSASLQAMTRVSAEEASKGCSTASELARSRRCDSLSTLEKKSGHSCTHDGRRTSTRRPSRKQISFREVRTVCLRSFEPSLSSFVIACDASPHGCPIDNQCGRRRYLSMKFALSDPLDPIIELCAGKAQLASGFRYVAFGASERRQRQPLLCRRQVQQSLFAT